MKNVLKSFAAFIFAALAISSCANSELVPETPKGPTHTVKFTSGVPETKTNMDIDPDSKAVTYTWTVEDLNRLDVYENGVKGTIDTENSSITATSLVIYATFDGGETTEPKEYTAVLNGVVGNQTPRVDENSYDEDADVLVAKPITATAAEGIEFQFRRAVAVNKMNLLDLPVGETLSTVKITSDKPISGIIDGNDWSEELLEYTIELSVDKEIPANGKLTLYYMAIPVDGAILTVDAKIGTDTYLKKFDKTLTTEAGNVKGYSVGLKKQAHIIFTENFSAKNEDGKLGNQYSTAGAFDTQKGGYDYTWTLQGKGNSSLNCIKLGGSNTSDSGIITSSDILSGIVSGTSFTVRVYAAQWNTDGGSIKVSYGDQNDTQTPANEKITSTTSTYSSNDFTSSNDFVFTKGDDTDLIVETTYKRIFIDKIEVVYDGDAPSAINAEDISNVVAAGVTDATFNFSVVNIIGTPAVTPDGTVVTAASVEGNTVTYTVAENTTFAAREGSIIIKVGEESKTVLVSQLGKVPSYEGEGTLESPYTVADALLKIETLEPDTESEEVYVAGPIKSITTTSDNFKKGQITYVLGTDESNIQIYCGKDFGGESFSSVEDITTGQNVVVKGKLTLYIGTKEMAANSQLAKVNGYDFVLKSIEVTGAKTQFDKGEAFSKGDAVVTASYRGNKTSTDVTTSAEFTGYASTVGTHEITVSYKENNITKTTTYDVTVADATKYGITVNQTGTGSGTVDVKVNGSEANEARFGASVEVTVTPNAKNHVEAFSITGLDGDEALVEGKYSFTMPANAVTINVQFESNPTAPSGTTLWSEDWTGYDADAKPSTAAAFAGNTVTYAYSNSDTKIYNAKLAGGTAPELLLKANSTMTISGIPTGNATAFTFTLISNKSELLVTVNGATVTKATGALEWAITLSGEADTFNMVITNNSSKDNARIDNLELVVGAPKSAQTISFTESSKSITLGDTYKIGSTYSIQTVSHPTGDGAVTYSVTEGDDVVSVNSSTGEVTIIKAGTAIITATAAETATYKEATASYELTIVGEDGPVFTSPATFSIKDSFTAPAKVEAITLSWAKGSYSSIPSVGSTYTKIYAGNIVTLSAADGYKITAVKLTASSSSYVKTWDVSSGSGSASDKYYNWTCGTDIVTTLTLTNSDTGQARINTIEVSFEKK